MISLAVFSDSGDYLGYMYLGYMYKAEYDSYGTEECSLLKARLSMENVCASRGEASTSGAREEQRRKHSVSGMILTDEIARCCGCAEHIPMR